MKRLFFVSARNSHKPVAFQEKGKDQEITHFEDKQIAKIARDTLCNKYEVIGGNGGMHRVVEIAPNGDKKVLEGDYSKDVAVKEAARRNSQKPYVVRLGPDHFRA